LRILHDSRHQATLIPFEIHDRILMGHRLNG
jgi:hypothetical protein